MKRQSSNTNTERLTLRISKNLLERIKRTAAENGISVSAFVRMVLSKNTKP